MDSTSLEVCHIKRSYSHRVFKAGIGSWINPENTAEHLVELITREEELKK